MAAPEAASAPSEGDDATGPTSLDQLLRRAADVRARERRAQLEVTEHDGNERDPEPGPNGGGPTAH